MPAVHPLPRAIPESHGIASSAIRTFVDALDREIDHLHSLMLLRDGHVLAEGWWHPYTPERPHMLFSLSKSFTSTAIGLAIAEGRLSLDDHVLSFFPDEAPNEPGEHLKAMCVRHLLSMSTGHADDTTPALREETNWARAFLKQPVTYPPGTHFLYNSGATYMLSAIIQRLTGMTLLDYLRPRLLDSLGIDQADWESCPQGVHVGGWGLRITTDAIARFGQLYLQRGHWEGRQLIPESWVDAAGSAQVSNGSNPESDWEQGYGFQFWRCRHNIYRGDGAFGQYCIVMPEQRAVLAITAGVADMQSVLNLVWRHLLPAFGPTSLPVDTAAHAALANRLATLEMPLPQGQSETATAAAISGATYRCEPNDQQIQDVTIAFAPNEATLTVRDSRAEHSIHCGYGAWLAGKTALDFTTGETRPVAAAYAWTNETSLVIKVCYTATPFAMTITCQVDGERLLIDLTQNVSFGPTTFPQVVCHR